MSPKRLFWEVFLLFHSHIQEIATCRGLPPFACSQRISCLKKLSSVDNFSCRVYSVTPSRELQAAEYLTVDNQNWESRNCGTPPFDIRQKVMTFGPSKRSSGSLFDGNSTFLCWRRNSKFSFCQKLRQFCSKMIHLQVPFCWVCVVYK